MSGSKLPVEVFVKDLAASNAREALTTLARALRDRGAVESSFASAVLEREEEYPTGLMFPDGGVAIPHTDTHHCRRPAIALGLLSKPVEFAAMGGSGEKEVPVRTILMLSVTDAREQAPTLSALMKSLSQTGKLASLGRMGSAKEVEATLWSAEPAEASGPAGDGSGWTAEKEAVVGPEEGLHARPAARFVQEARRYEAEILVSKDGREANAKSSIKVMSLGAKKGEKVAIRARGEDARAAVDALSKLISQEHA